MNQDMWQSVCEYVATKECEEGMACNSTSHCERLLQLGLALASAGLSYSSKPAQSRSCATLIQLKEVGVEAALTGV